MWMSPALLYNVGQHCATTPKKIYKHTYIHTKIYAQEMIYRGRLPALKMHEPVTLQKVQGVLEETEL